MSRTDSKQLQQCIQSLGVLIVEDTAHMRKLIRNLLLTIGVTRIEEAADGIEGLEAIRTFAPDVVLLDWEMPLLGGAEVVRIVRSPDVFPRPDLPIIVISSNGEHRQVLEATRLGVNEFVGKPVSLKALRARLMAIVARRRPIVQSGGYYDPEPRRALLDALRKHVPIEA